MASANASEGSAGEVIGTRRVVVAGHTVFVPELTDANELRTSAGRGSGVQRMLIRYSEDGQFPTQVPARGKFRVREGDQFDDLPVGEYGLGADS